MSRTRNLLLTSAVALATTLVAVSSASAITIRQEPGNTPCPAGPTVVAHVVTGGCHVTFAINGVIPLFAHTGAAEVVISSCTVTGELRVNSAGAGFVTNQVFGGGAGCTRTACDEAVNMRKIPWAATINGTAAAPTHELTFCLRTIASGEGGAGTNCTIHNSISAVGHTYTVGGGGEVPCEATPQVEISGSGSSTATERFELS